MLSDANTIEPEHILPTPRKLLPPTFPAPGNYLFDRIKSCDKILAFLAPHDQIFEFLIESWDTIDSEPTPLQHRLSPHMGKAYPNPREILSAERREAQIYMQWRHQNQDVDIHLEDIQQLNSLATGGNGKMRKEPIYVTSRDGRTHLPMVSWREAQQRLMKIPPMIKAKSFGSGILAATRILAIINNAHAFPDGNGRLGRFLFNYHLHHEGMPTTSYIPLKSLSMLSLGGYEIRLREVELFERWDELINYHCQTIMLIHRWAQTQSKAKTKQEMPHV